MWPHVTGSDPEVTSFDRKSPGSGCIRPKTDVYCTFHFLQGCSSQEEAVTWQEMTSRDLRWSEVTWKSPGSGCRRPETGVYCTFHFLQGCSRQDEAATRQEMTHVTSFDRSDPEVTSFDRKSPGSGCRRRKLACTVHFTSYKAVGRTRRSHAIGNDVTWPQVTGSDRKWCHLTGSHLEVAVKGQELACTVHFTSFKAVARRKRQSRDRKWRHGTSGNRKWPGSDVIWP